MPGRGRQRRVAFGEALTAALHEVDRGQVASRLGGIPQTSLRQWSAGSSAPPHYVVFKLEEILELAPGSLARHLGYVPSNVAVGGVEGAIRRDSLLEPADRDALIALYRELTHNCT